MSFLDNFYNWEEMSVSQIIANLVRWEHFDKVEFIARSRVAVESGMWFEIFIEKNEKRNCISGQRLEIVKARLIAHLDRLNIRAEYLKNCPKQNEQ